MITFTLNNEPKTFEGDPNTSLLNYLREVEGITSAKDGCSGQGACGSCLLEMNGKPVLSCRTKMSKAEGASVTTIEGFDPQLKDTLAKAFAEKGAVQCGFCSPGFLSRAKILLDSNSSPTRDEIKEALKLNLCRCTGYVKIVDAIYYAAQKIAAGEAIDLPVSGTIGDSYPKLDAYHRALGENDFASDMNVDGMLHGALKFSDHPRAEVISIDSTAAERIPGVKRVFTADDIPGDRITGHLIDDWPLMVKAGEVTRYIGDVLAGVVAETEEIAREACEKVIVEYNVLPPLTDVLKAETSKIKVHENGNLLNETIIQRGEPIDETIASSDFVVKRTYQTQLVEHGFLETEAALAEPWEDGELKLFVQSQGIYEDRHLVSRILDIPEDKIDVILIPSGGAFGGKEDLTVQGHAALFSFLLKKPVKVRLTRPESLRMHPKRHPLVMEYEVGCDKQGKLTGLKARIIGDTGAYASLGPAVMNRSAGHAAAGFHVPNVDVSSKAIYTNTLPAGAMRGFGVNQVTFAMECAVDELCELGGFDRWQFRYDNALENGSMTTTGQILKGGVGLKQTLLAVKEDFQNARYAGIAMGIKNIGFGNGLVDESETRLDIQSDSEIILSHGWTEMGQGIDTIAVQIFCETTGLNPELITINHSTTAKVLGGTTTASRGTFLLGNSVIEVALKLKKDLEEKPLKELVGKTYRGTWTCDWTDKPGSSEETITHVAYGYATQVVILDDDGELQKVIAAHDVGKAINPKLLEGQVEGGVAMGLGYAYSEDLPLDNGQLVTTRFGKLGIPKIKSIPEIDVRIVEEEDPHGPYGAKGIGEIGLVPTTPASANALFKFDGKRRYQLPLSKGKK